MALRIATTLTSASAGLILFERVPIAYHEAGHAVVACHLGEAGLRSDNGICGNVVNVRDGAAMPMLRYATITPRYTPKGQLYMGETKLTLRWRDMPGHLTWVRGGGGGSSRSSSSAVDSGKGSGSPVLQASGLEEPTALLGLARIAYLFGGRASEERLSAALLPAWWPERATARGGPSETSSVDEAASSPRAAGAAAGAAAADVTRARVARLLEQPGTACGDLRKAQQIALEKVVPATTTTTVAAATAAAPAPRR